MLDELRKIREAVERIEAAYLRREAFTCPGCAGVFRTRGEYEEHQCGLAPPLLSASSVIDQCPNCLRDILVYDSSARRSYCRQCGWMAA